MLRKFSWEVDLEDIMVLQVCASSFIGVECFPIEGATANHRPAFDYISRVECSILTCFPEGESYG